MLSLFKVVNLENKFCKFSQMVKLHVIEIVRSLNPVASFNRLFVERKNDKLYGLLSSTAETLRKLGRD